MGQLRFQRLPGPWASTLVSRIHNAQVNFIFAPLLVGRRQE